MQYSNNWVIHVDSPQNFLLKSNLTEEGEAVLEIYRMLQNGGMDAADKVSSIKIW